MTNHRLTAAVHTALCSLDRLKDECLNSVDRSYVNSAILAVNELADHQVRTKVTNRKDILNLMTPEAQDANETGD